MTQKQRWLTPILSFLIFIPLFAQNFFQKSYHRNFTEHTVGLESLPNGHVVLAGYTFSETNQQKSIWLMRLNASGDVIWTNTYSLGQNCEATAVHKTTDGNLLVTYNTLEINTNTTVSGWIKISSSGAIIWSKKAVGSSSLTHISPAASNGYLLTGYNAIGTQTTGLVVRIGEDGEIQWSTVFGENGNSEVHDCWEDALGFIHCCGFTNVVGGDRNGFWAKLGSDGELVGPVKRFGTSQADELTRIVPYGADRLLLSGYSRGFGNSAYSSAWVVVLDDVGTLKFSKTFSLEETNLVTNDLVALPGDQFLLAFGTLSGQLSPAIMTKLSFDLDQLFAFQYKGGSESDAFYQAISTTAGFAAAGLTRRNGDSNAYYVTTDKDGKLDSDDCCPAQVNITRQDVNPVTGSFVPTQTAFYAVQNATLAVSAISAQNNNLCLPLGLEFTVSQDTICPGECFQVTPLDSVPGVIYSFEIQGGKMNSDAAGQICHTSGSAVFVIRKGKNGNCEKSLTKRIVLGSKMDRFPNAFTPNGDNANDVFKPVFGCPAVSMHFQIFNRWGHLVFETIDPIDGWDGKIYDLLAPSDVYVWRLEYEVENNGSREKLFEQGEVTLLR